MQRFTGLLVLGASALAACDGPTPPSGDSAVTSGAGTEFALRSTIALTSTRDDPGGVPLLAAEIYLLDADGTNPRRLTENDVGDAFPALSPDGRKIVFDSNRRRAEGEPINISDLFVMGPDGGNQTWLARGSSATWSPDGKWIAYHASASGSGLPIRTDPGSATEDSDIFVANVDDLLAGTAPPRNVTRSADWIDDDPDWSPVEEKIVFTRHPVTDDPINSAMAEIYTMNADGTGLARLTFNGEEERAASWSPDGSRIVFSCRRGGSDFEICLMNADGTDQQQLTSNTLGDLTATFSPDGNAILFHRNVPGDSELWVLTPDGTGGWAEHQLTNTGGRNLLANWGALRVRVSEHPWLRRREPSPLVGGGGSGGGLG